MVRVLGLEGGQNFRDLGGYPTRDGGRVKWGQLFRSGSMARLSPGDFEVLRERGIRTVVDFRSLGEREREPVAWPPEHIPVINAWDYEFDTTRLGSALGTSDVTAAEASEAFANFCGELPYRFAHQYREMFARLIAGEAPLILNCSAGKDRTGVGAALLLHALDVPRETIFEDYLLSRHEFDPRKTLATDVKADSLWRRLPPEVLRVVMGVDRRNLDAAFAAIEGHPGGMEAFYEEQLGLSSSGIATLRALYVEDAS